MGGISKKACINHIQEEEEEAMAATDQHQLNINNKVREMFAVENHGFKINDQIVNSVVSQQPSFSLSSQFWSPLDGEGDGINNEKNLRDKLGRMSCDNDAEKSLIAKLSGLSLAERTQAIYELHGVADNIEEESSEMIQTKLREMTVVANSFGDTNATAAYRMAVEMNSHYVDTQIKLLCLRSTYYDVEKATARMMSFFSFKRRLFGDEKLTKDIVRDDLNEKDEECLHRGFWQLALGKDRASRAIVIAFPKYSSLYGFDTLLRSFYYVAMQALRDEDVQKKGIVHIFYADGKIEFHSDRAKKYADMWLFFPVRIAAMHFCYDSAVMDLGARMVEQAMEADNLCRFRRHKGSAIEVTFNLMTFGIPKELLPVNTETGEILLHHHHKLLETWKIREQQLPLSAEESGNHDEPKTKKEIAVPGPMDIVIGLGRQSISSVGYMKFRDVLLGHRTEYENSARFEKTMIARKIYKKLEDNGCRFVRSEDGILTEATEVEARDKISHAFRNMRQQGARRKGRETGAAKRRASQ